MLLSAKEWRGTFRSNLGEFSRRAERELAERGLKILSRLEFTAKRPTIVLVLSTGEKGARVRGSAVLQALQDAGNSEETAVEVRASRARPARLGGNAKNPRAAALFEAALEDFFGALTPRLMPRRTAA